MPTLRNKGNSKNDNASDDAESSNDDIIGRQRSSRRLAGKQDYKEDNDAVEDETDEATSDSNSSDGEGDVEMDDVDEEVARRPRGSDKRATSGGKAKKKPAKPEARRSARSTKFASSMTEPSTSMKEFVIQSKTTSKSKAKSRRKNEDDDLEDSDSDEKEQPTKSKSKQKSGKARGKAAKNSSPGNHKSPARRHVANRRVVQTDESSEEDDNMSDDDEENDEEPLRIHRILASRTEKIRKWREICGSMNSSEVHFGSRWYQTSEDDDNSVNEDEDGSGSNKKDEDAKRDSSLKQQKSFSGDADDVFEERFLVKWWDLSYLHCSWETQTDIVNEVDGGKNALSMFFRKSSYGLLFSADERCDGDYFDPGYTQIDRILEVQFPNHEAVKMTAEDEDNYNESAFGMIHDKNDPEFNDGTGRQFLVKWSNLPYTDGTYEFERDLIINDVEYKTHLKSYLKRDDKLSKTAMKLKVKRGEDEFKRLYKIFGENDKIGRQEQAIEECKAKLQERVFKNGGQLRDYQAEGVAWMISNFVNRRSSILCDEMGLGKTLQTAATADLLVNGLKRNGPILIVAPLSTLTHWHREFCRWTDLNAIIYHGDADDRKLIRQNEFAYTVDRPPSGVGINALYLKKCCNKKSMKLESPWMVQVVITTPEMMICDDCMELASVEWEALVVDEAHRMKNHNSKLAVTLRNDRFTFKHKILLTGTPIQNDVQEFWTILNFIDPDKFNDMKAFMDKYGEMKSKELVDELHEEIRPFILRRLKEDVEKSVPPKEETLIEVELTVDQKQYYRALYEKNLKFLHKNKKRALEGPSLNNLAMQLRKVCNHVFLLNGIEEEFREKTKREKLSEREILTRGSGKLVLLDKLLPRLKEEGHRVLIFSQFKIVLDILEDYLNTRSMKFERIDGSITGKRRQQAIDRFQSPDSVTGKESPFIMMLTTRAGGVGINLTAADTCIIFDSDWNPQNDLQAQARCHRIGQTKSVKVYRLLSRKTYEMQMFHMSSLKMGLDQAVLNGVEGGSSEATLSKDEVEKLLRHGAYDIFNEDKSGKAEAESNEFVQEDIDSILQRRSKVVVHDNTGSSSGAAGGTFSKATFKVSKSTGDQSEANGTVDDIDIEDPDFWKKMIGEPKADEDMDILLTTKRRQRKQITSYSEQEYTKNLEEALGDGDSDSDATDHSDEDVVFRQSGTRSKWGGAGAAEWSKDEADNVAKVLATVGYGRLNWDAFTKIAMLRKPFATAEIKRMCFSIIFIVIKEITDDDTESLMKKDQVAADRTIVKQAGSINGGILAVQSSSSNHAKVPKFAESKNQVFMTIIRSLMPWINDVLKDAADYAKENEPRMQDVIEKMKHLKTTSTSAASVFATNVWPSLKSRGWKVTLISEGDQAGKSRYSYKDKDYSSTNAVLAAARTIHPELGNVIDTILEQTKESRQQTTDAQEKERIRDQCLSLDTLDYQTVLDFIYRYAPLQIIADRTGSNRVRLSRKILSSCTLLHNASVLINRVPHVEGLSKIDELASTLSIDKRFLLPHSLWTPRHDAVLVHAIAKHGWIDSDASCRAITNDPEIKWGPPFDSLNSPKPATASASALNSSHLRSAALRAAKFLNEQHELIGDVKGFNHHILIRAYGLTKDLRVSSNWIVNPDALECTNFTKIPGHVVSKEPVELPTKKDLVKRAKVLLSRSHVHVDARKTAIADNPSFPFSVLDQSNTCNMFLAELIRALIRESCGSKTNGKLCSFAMSEAKQRVAEISSLSKSPSTEKDVSKLLTDHQSLVQHLELVRRNLSKSVRQYKNVLRVILGEEPVKSKHVEEGLFPKERPITSTSVLQEGNWDGHVKSSGDRAVEKARKQILDRFGTKEGMSSIGNGSKGLDLTEIETLILSAVFSQGLPVWSKDWKKSTDPLSPGSETRETNHWSYLGFYVNKMARGQFNRANDKFTKATREYDRVRAFEKSANMGELKNFARRTLEKAQALLRSKQEVLRQSVDYNSCPDHLAKKCILLLAKIQQNAASKIQQNAASSANGSPSLNSMSHHGLGAKVLEWLESEICRWSKSLALLADDGQPLAFTAIDFLDDLPENERVTIEIYGSFDKKACRSVLEQSALMSRLRSVFTHYTGSRLRTKLDVAARDLLGGGDVWRTQPAGWDVSCDVVLLQRLAKHGFTEDLLKSRNDFGECGTYSKTPYSEQPLLLPKGVIQSRANQLVRELNAIEDRTNDARSRILEERRNKDISTSTLDKENISGSKATACARQNVSMDSDRLSLEDGDASDDEVIIIEPPSADIPANCVASLLQVDDKKRSSTAERETGLLDLHASPEKKHRVS